MEGEWKIGGRRRKVRYCEVRRPRAESRYGRPWNVEWNIGGRRWKVRYCEVRRPRAESRVSGCPSLPKLVLAYVPSPSL